MAGDSNCGKGTVCEFGSKARGVLIALPDLLNGSHAIILK